ncbi:MAG: hypothetical protein R2932_21170 [Caldilineaceae bacterium]
MPKLNVSVCLTTPVPSPLDNGPSAKAAPPDGNQDPYYGGSAGKLTHKQPLRRRILCAGYRTISVIPAGQALDEPCASMDIFPTFLAAAGGDVSGYEIDGTNLLPYACDGQTPATRPIFWEQGKQTALRRGEWKLVLQGQLVVKGLPPEDDVHLPMCAKIWQSK